MNLTQLAILDARCLRLSRKPEIVAVSHPEQDAIVITCECCGTPHRYSKAMLHRVLYELAKSGAPPRAGGGS